MDLMAEAGAVTSKVISSHQEDEQNLITLKF